MSTVTIWLLLAISSGYGNYGHVTVVERFTTAQDCWSVVEKIKGRDGFRYADYTCTEAKVAKP